MLPRMPFVVLSTLFALAGCAGDSNSPPTAPAPAPFSLTPANSTTDVQLNAPVTLTFPVTVDRAVVERDLHLISEFDLMSAPCPDTMMAPHSNMMSVMADSMMMRHLGAAHATDIGFEWNASGTECTVRPTAWLRPLTRYMVHVGREMSQMMESRMGTMAGMADHGSGSMGTDMMFHFTTLDTTGGGHLGHH